MKYFFNLILTLFISIASIQAQSKVMYALSTRPDSVALAITYYEDKIEIESTWGTCLAELFSQNDNTLTYRRVTYGNIWDENQKRMSYRIIKEHFYDVSKDRRSLRTEVIDRDRIIYGGPSYVIIE